nr:hypothetical protein [Tanacetum cinerariifolium]
LFKVRLAAKGETLDNEDSLGDDASKQGMRIDDINSNEDITLVNIQANAEMFDADKDLGGEELQAKFDEKEQRLTTDRAERELEANIALIETWDDVQAKIDKRRKFFAAKEKRNKPPTQAQKRKIMCIYLKNIEGYKLNHLKSFEFDKIQEMFDRAFKRVNTIEPIRSELVEGKEKRAGEDLEQDRSKKQKNIKFREGLLGLKDFLILLELLLLKVFVNAAAQKKSKKQKVYDDKETTELKKLMEIIPNEEEVAIDAIPLAVKSPGIFNWKIYKEGKKSYYQIIRADGKSKMYMFFSQMLTSFDMEDLKDLYKLIKDKYGSTRPMEDLDLLLWGDLKTMFEPHIEDDVWRKQQGYKVLEWKLYDSCEVHYFKMQSM